MNLLKALFLSLLIFSQALASECTKVGILGEFERPTARTTLPFGADIMRGVTLAQKLIGQSSKKGPCFRFKLLDIQNSFANIPILIRRAAESEKIHLFLGLGISDQVLMATRELKRSKSILLTPTASSDQFAGADSRVIMIFPRNSLIASRTASFMIKKGVTQVSIISSTTSSYSKNIAMLFEAEFTKQGGKIELAIRSRNGELSGADVERIRNSSSDFIFLPLFELDVVRNVSFLYQNGIRKKYIGSDSWGTLFQAIKKFTSDISFEVVLPRIYSEKMPTAKNQLFVKTYMNEHQTIPSDLAAFSFDGIMLLREILKHSDIKRLLDDPTNALLKALPFDSLTGVIPSSFYLSLNRPVFIKTLKKKDLIDFHVD